MVIQEFKCIKNADTSNKRRSTMQIQMTGHGLDISTALRELAEKKIKSITPMF